MSDQNLIWIKDHVYIIPVIIGFGIALFVIYIAFQSGYDSAIQVQRNNFFVEGLFAYNDIYNTCTYIAKDGSFKYEGYCFNQKNIPDRLVEACITGCKLQADFNEDITWCKEHCETCLIGDC